MRAHVADPRRRLIAVLMTAATATLAVASILHFGVAITAGGVTLRDPYRGAAVPEAVIAAVLAAGLVALVASPPRARAAALAATLFAVAGFLVGLRFTVFAGGPRRPGDVAYHLAGLALLGVIAALLARSPAHRAV